MWISSICSNFIYVCYFSYLRLFSNGNVIISFDKCVHLFTFGERQMQTILLGGLFLCFVSHRVHTSYNNINRIIFSWFDSFSFDFIISFWIHNFIVFVFLRRQQQLVFTLHCDIYKLQWLKCIWFYTVWSFINIFHYSVVYTRTCNTTLWIYVFVNIIRVEINFHTS